MLFDPYSHPGKKCSQKHIQHVMWSIQEHVHHDRKFTLHYMSGIRLFLYVWNCILFYWLAFLEECDVIMSPMSLAESNPADYASKLKRLPQDLLESVESLAADKTLHELIGDKLITAIIAVRKVSAQVLSFTLWTLENSRKYKEKYHIAFFLSKENNSLDWSLQRTHSWVPFPNAWQGARVPNFSVTFDFSSGWDWSLLEESRGIRRSHSPLLRILLVSRPLLLLPKGYAEDWCFTIADSHTELAVLGVSFFSS